MRVSVNVCDEFDSIKVGMLGGYYTINFLNNNATIYKEKYLIGLFNKHHFMSNMDELGIDKEITNQILNFYENGKTKKRG